jgi:FkbM family methyltransferase
MIDIPYKLRRVRRWAGKIGFIQAVLFELQWSLRRPRIRVKVPRYSRRFVIRRDETDIYVFEAVFIDDDIHVPELKNPRLILDGGANVGYTTAYLALEHPSAQVIAVEPHAGNCEIFRLNCRGLHNVTLVEGALWMHAGFMRAEDAAAESWKHTYAEAESPTVGGCRAYTIDEIIASSESDRCDLLKLDIEGAELQLFSANEARWIDSVDIFLIESHSDAAEAAIRRACPADKFHISSIGEKLLIVRK